MTKSPASPESARSESSEAPLPATGGSFTLAGGKLVLTPPPADPDKEAS